jgi:hypothetical protein
LAGDLQREADELARYVGELGRRVETAGVRDVGSLLALHEQLRRALDAVSPQELAWAAEQADRLIGTLEQYANMLATVRRLKDGAAPAR